VMKRASSPKGDGGVSRSAGLKISSQRKAASLGPRGAKCRVPEVPCARSAMVAGTRSGPSAVSVEHYSRVIARANQT
jgi:hypothetical protein